MLSRVADSLYWMSRYLERAEHTARVLDVHLNLMLDQTEVSAGKRWARIVAALGVHDTPTNATDAHALTRMLAFDGQNRSSVVSCVVIARENARQVREQISSEMWEQLNRLFHEVRRADWDTQPIEFLRAVREGAHLFQGVTDGTIAHGDGWQFIQIGRFLERAKQVATLLDIHYREFVDAPELSTNPGDHLEWIGLLKCCTAHEAYCKVYTAELTAARIAEFLLLNAEFPHSVRFCVDMLHAALNALPESNSRKSGRATRLAGKLRAGLSFAQVDEIMAGGLHTFLETIERQCVALHSTIHQVYIDYPVEAAIEA